MYMRVSVLGTMAQCNSVREVFWRPRDLVTCICGEPLWVFVIIRDCGATAA